MRAAVLLLMMAVAGCGDDIPPDRSIDLALHDEVFASARDQGVLCAGNGDDRGFRTGSVMAALDRARDRGEIVEVFMHDPGHTVSTSKLETVLAGARERGLRFVTYRELAEGAVAGPGLALAFDDNYPDDWAAQRPLLAQYGARVTFFVTLYLWYSPAQKDAIQALAGDGHDIEFHTTTHEAAPAYVETYGMDAYLAHEVDTGLDAMHADGYDPIVYAYPAGLRTPELDVALLARFKAVRATTLHCPHLDE